jgi:hypothetical protein
VWDNVRDRKRERGGEREKVRQRDRVTETMRKDRGERDRKR